MPRGGLARQRQLRAIDPAGYRVEVDLGVDIRHEIIAGADPANGVGGPTGMGELVDGGGVDAVVSALGLYRSGAAGCECWDEREDRRVPLGLDGGGMECP
jgi:hypothetical protein